jgi:hypothetical protein
MIYSKNYTRREIILNFDASKEEYPKEWGENDAVKVLGTEDYLIDKEYKLRKIKQ